MQIPPTARLYIQDDHCFETNATGIAVHDQSIAFDATCFYPGGGGQPPDEGVIEFENGEMLEVISVNADSDDVIWHGCKTEPSPNLVGRSAHLVLNKDRRLAHMRYHTILHVLNTIVLKEYNGWITGVRIQEDYSRIDFKLENFSPELVAALETKVNAALERDLPLRSYSISEEEFQGRRDLLLRTLEAMPPISHGQVRVVEITGFDAQACGGTHVRATAEVGKFTIFRTDNKGKINKRFYVRLDPA